MKLLLLEDDPETADFVAQMLRSHGHVVDLATTGPDAIFLATSVAYAVLILDRMVPGVDGLGVLRTLRGAGIQTPALFLSALGEISDRVEGLDAGSDDYLVKPFAASELLARVQALARRSPVAERATVIVVGDLEIDQLARTVTRAGKRIDLQHQEYRLLDYLARHAGQVVTRTMLLEQVWDFHFDPGTNLIASHISRLRSKLDRGFEREMIRTVRGSGYVLDAPS
ncbi:winged helix-turn-helix domain-containing protein [Novosphingobium pituita]|jgi:two-component system OmpR family response regulator|uniref:Winged helix-turn-helix domain-containing protein n=1 Tax=Novosphingobium pituita TaxID=3056842 RepID=A0ABQ6P302_9SPHN|nr:response regulator transcription factor [Novosphingobium sp. IK01]MDK4806889.1 response regulator transcription factor [Novosphingobium aromaticivorans]GMM59633.1 winged helix-turn-helix domain-containing protein [Novosphingobium sp. IK01]HIQ18086.1 response regulator transcription factor [Novosphingobium capsulatum]